MSQPAPDHPHRRHVLQVLAGASVAALTPDVLAAPVATAAVASPVSRRRLLLVELKGGNDGLNTLVPIADPVYRRMRPSLAVDNALKLTGDTGLHPALTPLMAPWRAGELAWIQGLGYANPNRSHFRSGDIWCAADPANSGLQRGWLADALAGRRLPDSPADAILLGGDGLGPATGGRALALHGRRDALRRFVEQVRRVPRPTARTNNPAMAHVLAQQSELVRVGTRLRRQLAGKPSSRGFARDAIGQRMAVACDLLLADVPVPVIQVTASGFDTHANQAGRHARLLASLGNALSTLRANLRAAGMWDRVLVVTWSEFGRRVAENGSRGTDHGTAAPQLVMGGRVKGGLYGKAPSLGDLDGGDLKATADFRRLYGTIEQRWWGLPRRGAAWQAFSVV